MTLARLRLWSLGIILAFLPLYLWRFQLVIPTTVLEILIVVFLFLTLISMRREDWIKIHSLKTLNWAVGLFTASALVAMLISPNQTAALGQLKAFIIEPILFFYACLVALKTEDDKKTVLRFLFAGATFLSVFGLVQYFTFIYLPVRFWGTGDEVLRITSLFEYPNALALYLAPLIGFFAILWQKKYDLFKHAWILPLGLLTMLVAIILTFSRGAWLALLLTAALLLLKRLDLKKILGLAAVILIALAIPAVRERINLGLNDPSSRAHGQLMTVGIEKILQQPFLGNGLAGFPTTLEQAEFKGEVLNYPHNIFLNFWLELGLLGLISFIWLVVLGWEHSIKKHSAIAMAAGVFFVVMILHGLVDVPYFKNDLAVLFWFMLSLTI